MKKDIRILALFGSRVLFGQERANIETLSQLNERGCKVLCLIRDEEWPEIQEIRFALESTGLNWVKVPYIDYPARGWMRHILRRNPGAFAKANRRLKELIDEFSATHIHAFNSFYIANFQLALMQTKIPLIYRCGEPPVLHNIFYRLLWRFIKSRATHFVADSLFVAERLAQTGIGLNKISVIYAPAPKRVMPDRFEIPAAAFQDGAFRFIYVGQVIESKGVGLLIDAFTLAARLHKNAHLLIAGRIAAGKHDRWAQILRDRVTSNPEIADRVHFLGYVNDIPTLLANCNVHVAPSLGLEGYGLVVLEAKEAGIPSIIFRSGGIAELVSNEIDGLIANGRDAPSLYEAFDRYLLEVSLAQRHGLAARESLQKLGVSKFGERWLAVYECAGNSHLYQ